MTRRRPRIAQKWLIGCAATMALVLAACGSSSSTSSGSSGSSAATAPGLPATVKIMSIQTLTGPASFAGTNTFKGIDLALEQIQQQKFLGSTTVQLDTKDGGTSTQTAVSFASQAVADPSYSALIGPESAAQSAAISAIVQKAQMPTVYTQSGGDGVVIGDFTFRVTAPASSYFSVAGAYLKSKGITSAAVLYATNSPTLAGLGKTTIPAMATTYGFKIIASDTITTAGQDFTSFASTAAAGKPGAIFLMLNGTQDPVAITQLRRAGYTGLVVGMSAMGSGNLQPAGTLAAGAIWPTDFTADQAAASSRSFVKAYEAKYGGEVPNNYAAEGFDEMWLVARGIKQGGSGSRSAVQKGLAAVAQQGFDGAMGKLTFQGNDLRVAGSLATWDGAKETVIGSAGS